MIVSFIGHSAILRHSEVKEMVKKQLKNNCIKEASIVFYLGGYGEFDEICAEVCRELKRELDSVEVAYVTPYLNESAQEKAKQMLMHGLYDSVVYPPIEHTPKRFAILARNEWMMSSADLVIAYVKREYGGAYKALQFAKRKKKSVINISDLLVSGQNN